MSRHLHHNKIQMGFTTAMQMMINRAEKAEIDRKMMQIQAQEATANTGASLRSEQKNQPSQTTSATQFTNWNGPLQQDENTIKDMWSSLRRNDYTLCNKPLEMNTPIANYERVLVHRRLPTAKNKSQESKEPNRSNTETVQFLMKTSLNYNKWPHESTTELHTQNCAQSSRQLSYDMTEDLEASSHNETDNSPCPTELYEYWFSPGPLDAEKPSGRLTTSQNSMEDEHTTKLTPPALLRGGMDTTDNDAFSSTTSKEQHPLKNSFTCWEVTDTTESTPPKVDLLDWME